LVMANFDSNRQGREGATHKARRKKRGLSKGVTRICSLLIRLVRRGRGDSCVNATAFKLNKEVQRSRNCQTQRKESLARWQKGVLMATRLQQNGVQERKGRICGPEPLRGRFLQRRDAPLKEKLLSLQCKKRCLGGKRLLGVI